MEGARGMDRQSRLSWLIIPFVAWFLFFVLGPIGILFQTSVARRTELGTVETAFQFASYAQLLNPVYFEILLRTVAYSAANTCLTLALAFPMAFFLTRLQPKARTWVLMLVLIPFWTSFLVRVLSYVDVLRMHIFGIDLLYTSPGVLGALSYNYLPFAILPLYSCLEKIDNSILEAAKDLGASRLQVLTRVLLPLAKPGLTSAALFVFIPNLGEYLIPELVGGGKKYLVGKFLQNQFVGDARNWPLGSAAIMVLVLTTLVLLYFGSRKNEVKLV
jgi:spermidine/putrescine transport system permease protein